MVVVEGSLLRRDDEVDGWEFEVVEVEGVEGVRGVEG